MSGTSFNRTVATHLLTMYRLEKKLREDLRTVQDKSQEDKRSEAVEQTSKAIQAAQSALMSSSLNILA